MATIEIRKAHHTTRDDAQGRVVKMVEALRAERPSLVDSVSPTADGATASGRGWKGAFHVDDAQIRVSVDLSFLARMLKGRVEHELHTRLGREFGE